MLASRWVSSAFASLLALSAIPNAGAALVFSSTGLLTSDIVAGVNNFRASLGGALNPNVTGSFGSGRREINWDGVPAAFAAPNGFAANFFNSNSPRGVVFSTPGTGFQVSGATTDAGVGQPAVEFSNIDPTYPTLFAPFSAQRLFTAIGSNIVDVNLFIPGSTTGALTRGFGIVFSDVDVADTTSLQFFDRNNNSLGTFFAPAIGGNETFSFLGVDFGSPVIGRVRITSGNQILGAGNVTEDLVVMDDFIFAEPTAVPEPPTLALAMLALIAAGLGRRRTVPQPGSR